MSTKQPLPNQCDMLHPIYGKDDCCLCKANKKIIDLTSEVVESNSKSYKAGQESRQDEIDLLQSIINDKDIAIADLKSLVEMWKSKWDSVV
jgi:hypothetical protein